MFIKHFPIRAIYINCIDCLTSVSAGSQSSKINACIDFFTHAVATSVIILSILLSILTIFAPCQPLVLSSLICHDDRFLINAGIHYRPMILILFASSEFLLFITAGMRILQFWCLTKGCGILMDLLQKFCKSV